VVYNLKRLKSKFENGSLKFLELTKLKLIIGEVNISKKQCTLGHLEFYFRGGECLIRKNAEFSKKLFNPTKPTHLGVP